MATFFYTALKDNKTIVKGRVEAQDAAEARRKVRDMNLTPTSVTSSETQDKRKGRTWGKVSGLSLKEKIDQLLNQKQ